MRCFSRSIGQLHCLWRAVDQDGDVLDILVQSRRDKKAAKKFFRKLLNGLRYVPRLIITDKLRIYSAAKAEVLPRVNVFQPVEGSSFSFTAVYAAAFPPSPGLATT